MYNFKTNLVSLLGGAGVGYGFFRYMNCNKCAAVGFVAGTAITSYLYHVVNNYMMHDAIWGT